jgi:hypothetical protein
MRKFFVPALLAVGVTALVNTADVSFHGSSLMTAAVAQQTGGVDRGPDFKANVDIDAGTPSTTVRETQWTVDPLWIALAVGAVVLIAVLIAAGSRGGGTTIVKD